jgi:2',3'-cyclic-nucleotide 2'-phosphodiesterase (5'-nucleotidase family)
MIDQTTRRVLLAAAAALALDPALALAEPVTIRILQVNDWDAFEGDGRKGGFSRLMTVLEQEKAAAPEVLFIHAGDALSPSLLSSFDKGAHMIELLNRLPLDLFVMGNHEFDFGPENVVEQLGKAEFTVLNSNVRTAQGELFPGTVDEKLIEVQGVRLGFFGLTTPDTVQISSPGDTVFEPVLPTARAMVDKLRGDGADLVVAIAHTGWSDDWELFEFSGADLILTGHDHDLRVAYNGKVAMVESASQADYVTAIDLTVDRIKDGDRERLVWRPAFRAIDTATVAPHPAGLEITKAYEDKLSAELDVEIGTTSTPLDSRRATVRGMEAAIGNLIADAIRAAVDADVAITNGGGIRGNTEYPAGARLTRRDIQTELPFGNKTVKLEVTGAVIRKALENGFSKVEEGAGRFPQISGMTVTYDMARPAGARVVSVEIGGTPLDDARTYTLATNDFMARGGDGYTMLAEGKPLIDANAGQFMASQVMDYIDAAGDVAPAPAGRIVRLN